MKKILFTMANILLAAGAALGQNVDLAAPINPDPHVKIGKLDNGLTYYIRHNEYPKNVVEFRLAVNAGSNQEDEPQRGLAHFCEHMSFNGIEGMPGNEMVDKLQSLGVVFGADLNAYTSFDETVYMIPMPVDDPANIDVGLRILRGWAHGLLFDHKEIDAERGVITEEWRMGLGANDRMQKKYWPVMMKDSRYAERIPIGLIEVVQGFEYQVIKDFYDDWYRPDLQAVVVVGDVDVVQMEQKVKAMFGDIPAKQNPRKKETYSIGTNREPLACVCTDKEATGNVVMLCRKFPHFCLNNLGDLRKQMVIDLYNQMMDSRLDEMTEDPKCPFMRASSGYTFFIGSTDMYGSNIVCKENRITEAIQSVMREDYRVLRHGFLQTELDRAKEALMEHYERNAKEVDKTLSGRYANEYVDNFLHKSPIPGAKRELNYARKFMEGITIDEVNALAEGWITPENFVAVVMAPEKEGVSVPTEEEVLKTVTDPSLKDVSPYIDTYVDKEIVDKSALIPGTVAKTEDIPSVGAKRLTLSNGITVYLKKTDFKNDEIVFSASSKGGKSLYDVKDLPSLDFAAELVDRAGIADLDHATLMKKMSSKRVGIEPYIGVINEGLYGSTSPKDLDFFFQYLRSYFTSPRIDTTTYNIVMDEAAENIKMMKANPMYRFFGAFQSATTRHDPYMTTQLNMTEDYPGRVDYGRAVQVFKERFGNPADFTFTFVGNFDEKEMTDNLNLYLGSLTTQPGKKENFRAGVLKPSVTDKVTSEVVQAGTENQGWLGMYFNRPYEYNERNNMIIQQINDALNIYFIKIIREKMGDVYSPMLQIVGSKYPAAEFQTVIMLSCSPEKTDRLCDASIRILSDFCKKGPDKKTMEKVKKQLLSTHQKKIQTNNYWCTKINGTAFNDESFDDVADYEALVNSITKKDIVGFMKSHFDVTKYTRVDLRPEKQ